ncbi:MAG TPA: lytic transglycosylase domain-containing protein, partial [Pyrinomonadaceae bacterium]|nr:lytic transglycosylase domain-containing protein [Pyrinomonadaceae bacterium]
MRYLAVFTQLAVLTLALSLASTVPAQTEQTAEVQARINSVISEAGVFFRDGLQDLSQGRRNSTGDKFDKAVNTFLLSGLNIQSDKKLSACYAQMIETIYRLEYPGEMQPQIKSLSETCGWNWSQTDFAIADKVIKDTREFVAASNKSKEQPTQKQTIAAPSEDLRGFNWQQYEPSPLDDLAKLQLTPEEQDLNNPVAQQQYRYIEYAVANKSLGFSFQVHPLIQQFINYYRGRGRATMEVGLYRSGLFMPMARRIFREEGVPENVAWLGQVESAWKPTAVSWAAASGLWQFIPGTASRFGLKRTAHVDERNSFDEATRASARYLKFLYNRYGNWELAIAAYNCGEGNVDRAISRAGVANFWAAYPYLPQETRNYVPNILATILIANNPAQYGFGHIRPAPPL